jgi:hypothetical protein
MRIELPQEPGKYVRTQAGLDARGMLVVAIGNPTRAPLTGIGVTVQYVDSGGKLRELRRNLNGTLGPGQQAQLATGLGPFQSAEQFRVGVTAARIAD